MQHLLYIVRNSVISINDDIILLGYNDINP
jgi:hypothetical protein